MSNNCILPSIYNRITTIGDLKTEFDYDFDENDSNNKITNFEKNNLVSVLDIIDNYPSHQCASISKILDALFPNRNRNPLDNANSISLILRMYAPKLSRDKPILL